MAEASADGSANITNEYIFFNGKRIARRDSSGNVRYYLTDHLGSTRAMADGSGGNVETCDYYPFGAQIETSCFSSSSNRYRFTGKEGDPETDPGNGTANAYFGARYDSSRQGRFMTPDWSEKPQGVPYATLGNPQSLNLYSYVMNNPVSNRDLDGHYCFHGLVGSSCHQAGSSSSETAAEQQQNTSSAQKQNTEHPEHTAELGGSVLKDNGNGLSGKGDVGYATAKNTSEKGEVSGEVGIGGAKAVLNSDGGSTKGQVVIQSFTADANGKIGTGGVSAGANARVFDGSGQLSFTVDGHTVTLQGNVSAVGIGADAHITWDHGFSAGAGAILGAVGAGLSLTIRPSGDN